MDKFESNPEKEGEIINLYNKGIGTMELSRTFSCHRATIQRILKRNNITLRKTSPHKPYNVDFFSEYTPESVYWAGFIAADGYIRKDRNTVHIKLSSVDKMQLENFKKAIDFKHEVKEYEDYVAIDISGEWFINDLKEKYGLENNKTFDVSIHPKIPKSMINHFIRGYFDGDGSISLMSSPGISFSSGSKTILLEIREIFHLNINIKLKSKNKMAPLQKTSENANSFIYNGKNAKLILDWMYKDSDVNTRLKRKYLRYIDLFSRYENDAKRSKWEVDYNTPIFSQDRNYIEQHVYLNKEEAK